MKRLSVFLVLTLVLSFGLANGQTSVSLESVSSEFSPTQLATGQPTTFTMRVTNVPGENSNTTNGFRVFSPDGATWTPISGNVINNFDATYTQFFVSPFSATGSDADTIGFGGLTFSPTGGLQPGWDQPSFEIHIGSLAEADAGKTICIDSTWYPSSNPWKWVGVSSGASPVVEWSGQQCWEVFIVPDLPPDVISGPMNLTESHCGVFTGTYVGADPDACPTGAAILEYYIVSGPGAIDPVTGVWSWSGGTVPQSGNATVEIGVRDLCGPSDGGATWVTNLTITNEGPTFTGGCGASTTIQSGDTKSVQFTASDDCDVLTYSITNDGGVAGAVSIDASGLLTYSPVDADGPATVVMEVTVSDGELTDVCTITWEVILGAPYTVRIEPGAGYNETCEGFLQGQFAELDIVLEGVDPNQGIGGFNFVIAYDASALSFTQATEGDIFGLCNWEYFEYRYGPDGNCNGGCPSGLLRVVGIAESNDGAGSPTCGTDEPVGPTSLASLTFLVSNDRTLECQALPVRFFWLDCGDNTISNLDGSELYISAKVFDFGNENPINDGGSVFPTFLGAPDVCLQGDKVVPIRNVDFTNGRLKICCAEDIDARGDINLNGIAYEIADAVMLTNYFVEGLSAFTYPDGATAASDVNADGIVLSVADLVYLIRVVVGDALPYPKDVPAVNAEWFQNGSTINVDKDMGAAYIVVEGNVSPNLIADNMDMVYRFDGQNTNILVFSHEANQTFVGDFVAVDGNVISVEMATYDGIPVAAKNVPKNFSLEGNYPNPFNPTTNIKFNVPSNVNEWSVTIYNVTGQVVETISGTDNGIVNVVWDASELASGIYFYKVVAGDNSATQKAVLLK